MWRCVTFYAFNPPLAQDCTGNIVAASNAFSFITNNGLPTVYKLDTVKKQILKSSDGGTTFIGVTATRSGNSRFEVLCV